MDKLQFLVLILVTVRENRGVSPEEEKEGYGGKDLHQQNLTVVNWRCRVLRTLTSIMAVKRWLLL